VADELAFVIGRLSLVDAHSAEAEDLLSQCIYRGDDPSRRAAALAIYDNQDNWLLGARRSGLLVGLVGLCPKADYLEIRHIAVRADLRRKAIGRRIIEKTRQSYPKETLFAETDKDAVGFYRQCGFSCKSIGEKYPGTERFECTLAPAPIARSV
jgi:ribosomal protein S18 acetylase RimI-like enzyme